MLDSSSTQKTMMDTLCFLVCNLAICIDLTTKLDFLFNCQKQIQEIILDLDGFKMAMEHTLAIAHIGTILKRYLHLT